MITFRVLDAYLIALAVSLNAILIASAQQELKFVNVIFRHGDRTPDNNGYEMYPFDPYLNYSFYPEGLGQLTLQGKQREYELGKFLRDKYNDFLGDMYLPKKSIARSSDYDRTKMSLQLVLAAMFPPNARQRWNSKLDWQPIPTSYVPRVDDNLFLSDECPQFLKEYNRVLDSPEGREKMARFEELSHRLTELTGKKIENPLDFYYLYHTFVAESSMNLTLPAWAHEYFPNGSLFDAIVTAYNLANYTPLLKKLYAGPIIRTMLNNMKAVQNSLDMKIGLYSGHETNIASMLHAFNVYIPHVPEYSSAVILEMIQQNMQYYVKLLYYRGIPPIADVLEIPGCGELCPFNKFLELTRDLIPSDEELLCDKRQTPDYAGTKYPAVLQSMLHNLVNKFMSSINNKIDNNGLK